MAPFPRSPRRALAALAVLGASLLVLASACGANGVAPGDDVADSGPADVAGDGATPDGAPGDGAAPDGVSDGTPVDNDAASDVSGDAPSPVDGDASDAMVDVGPVPCSADGDCAGRLPGLGACRRAACDRRAGFCAPVAEDDGAPCDDGDACTVDSVCRAGLCRGRARSCDDGVFCTEDRCDSADGCLHPPRAAACDDGDPCTEGDACQAGECRAGRNVCPCDTDEDCVDHGDVCTGALTCSALGCALDPAAQTRCEEGAADPCTILRCDAAEGGCVSLALPDGHPCDDGDVCTGPDRCGAGRCRPGPVLTCDDGNPCTTDRCDEVAGCLSAPNQRACDDGDPCTETDRCEESLCLPGTNNPCLDETCTPVWTLRCDAEDRWTRDADVATDLLDDYACPGATGLAGPEITYVLVAPFTGDAILRLAEAAEGTRAVVLEAARRGCDPRSCRAAAVPGEDVRFSLTAGRVYFVVIDAPSGVAREFAVALSCAPAVEIACDDGIDDDGDGATDCDDADCLRSGPCAAPDACAPRWELSCGAPVAGRSDAPGHTSRHDVYGCAAGAPVLGGPEVRYAFTPPVDGTYRARLRDRTGPLEIVVAAAGADPCTAGACRGRGREVSFEGRAGEPVVVLVDGTDEVGAAFTLDVVCPEGREVDCGDGRDDDGDGATDCADADCDDRATCAAGACRPLAVVGCGDVVGGVTRSPGHTVGLVDYPCSLFRFTGPEVAYAVDVPEDVTVTARLLTGDPALDVFLIAPEADAACAAAACVAQGDDVAEARSGAGRGLFAVVDGHDGTDGPFTLAIECEADHETACEDGRDDDGDGLTDCLDADCLGTTPCPSCAGAVFEEIGCDETRGVSTLAPAATESIVRYGCTANPYPGRERIYAFEPGLGGDITITLEDEAGALDLMLLEELGDGCNPAACVRTSPYRVRFRAAGGRRYYIAVDGYAGEGGDATLVVDCEDQ